MSNTKKSPEQLGGSNGANQKQQSNIIRVIRQGTKLHDVLSCLVTGKHLHRFQAERICHDHVLPTTVSDLQSVYGLVINRKLIRVPGHKGRMATVSNYWLEESELLKAEKLLEKRDGQ